MLQKLIRKAALAETIVNESEVGSQPPFLDPSGTLINPSAIKYFNTRVEFWEKAIFGDLKENSNGELIKQLASEDAPNAILFWMPHWKEEDLKNLFWDNSDPDCYSEYISSLSEIELDSFLHDFIKELRDNYDTNTSYDWDNMQHLLQTYTKGKTPLAPSDIVGSCDFCSEDISLALTVSCDSCDKEFCQNCNESENDSEIICPNCI